MKTNYELVLSLLADGKLHSGETLAQQLVLSRAAIWKSIQKLKSLGLSIESVTGKGYRLIVPIDLLSVNKIKHFLSSKLKRAGCDIEILFKTNSTNSTLVQFQNDKQIHRQVLFAEYQSHGRGRRSKHWLAPLASGLTFSIGWQFIVPPETIGLLSLFIGVAVARVLQSQNIDAVGLKWPNDVFVQNKKIAGILIEVSGETGGPINAVVGVGFNYQLAPTVHSQIEYPITDFYSHTKAKLSRNNIAALLISNIFEILEKVTIGDTDAILAEWRTLDCCKGQQARLVLPNEEVDGILQGVDDRGLLMMSVAGTTRRFNAGEISLQVLPS